MTKLLPPYQQWIFELHQYVFLIVYENLDVMPQISNLKSGGQQKLKNKIILELLLSLNKKI